MEWKIEKFKIFCGRYKTKIKKRKLKVKGNHFFKVLGNFYVWPKIAESFKKTSVFSFYWIWKKERILFGELMKALYELKSLEVKGKKEIEKALREKEKIIAEAKEKAASIIEKAKLSANKEGEKIIEEARKEAEKEAKRILGASKKECERIKKAVKAKQKVMEQAVIEWLLDVETH